VFDNMMASSSALTQGVSTPQDLEAVRKTFHEVAVTHVSPVRDAMLELRFGDADPSWLASTKPALSSLRAMAAQVDLKDLCAALDEFSTMIDTAAANSARISDEHKASLLGRYQRLIELIPRAFELDAERDRREPIIIEALLLQIDGVERPTMDKLFAVGLNRLDALTVANAQDVVAVSGIRVAIAEAIVAQFQAYRARTKAAVSVRDPAGELHELAELVKSLSTQNADFSRAASAWSEAAVARKRELRKQREHTYQRIKVSLARLGARDQLSKLERLPFDERIEALGIYLSARSPVG
jgi:chemotaxis protein histidine kinase CheA